MNANTISRPRTVTMQRMQITIRQAGVEDHERLSSLARETFVDSFAADNHPENMAAYLEKHSARASRQRNWLSRLHGS